ncbi:MAG: hypothetical protein MUE81_12505 [Thermoflexibacter sp.]|jgi:hypothetical protein|nr:hypothetical protein [Thermoflexibacter sp.]
MEKIELQEPPIVYNPLRATSFPISGACWHELYPKLKIHEIEPLLFHHLKLTDYTDTSAVKRYFFMFVIMPPDNPNHDSWGKYFSAKSGIIHNYVKMDFELFKQANESEALQMQAEAYLQGITIIPSLRGMKNIFFDTEKLYADVKNLFLRKEWVGF